MIWDLILSFSLTLTQGFKVGKKGRKGVNWFDSIKRGLNVIYTMVLQDWDQNKIDKDKPQSKFQVPSPKSSPSQVIDNKSSSYCQLYHTWVKRSLALSRKLLTSLLCLSPQTLYHYNVLVRRVPCLCIYNCPLFQLWLVHFNAAHFSLVSTDQAQHLIGQVSDRQALLWQLFIQFTKCENIIHSSFPECI